MQGIKNATYDTVIGTEVLIMAWGQSQETSVNTQLNSALFQDFFFINVSYFSGNWVALGIGDRIQSLFLTVIHEKQVGYKYVACLNN